MKKMKRLLSALAVSALVLASPAAPAAGEGAPVRPAVISLPVGGCIVYGRSLSDSVLSGGIASDPVTGRQVEGEFVWANGDFVPGVGIQECACEFIPSGFDAEFYLPVSLRAQVEVKRIPVLVTEAPVCQRHVEYGEPLSGAGLSGGVCTDPSGGTVPGTWRFDDAGAVPLPGRTEAPAVFVPEDAFHYEEAFCTVTAQCDPCTPEAAVTCTRALPGSPLSECTLMGWASALDGSLIPGSFAFRDGDLVPAGDGTAYDVTFTPDDRACYLPVTVKVPVTFGLKTVSVTAVLRAEPGWTPEEGQLVLKAEAEDGLDVPGALRFDEKVAGKPLSPEEDRIGAVFVPRDGDVYISVPVSVKVVFE